MAHTLTIELSDDMFEAVRQVAQQTGKAPEVVALEGVARHVATTSVAPRADTDKSEAWQQLHRFFGAIDSGDPHSANNERIDADLAREYAAERET